MVEDRTVCVQYVEELHVLMVEQYTCRQGLLYRLSGTIGGESNLAVWRSRLEPPNYTCKFRQYLHVAPGDICWLGWAHRQINSANIFECPVWRQIAKSPNLMPTSTCISTYTVLATQTSNIHVSSNHGNAKHTPCTTLSVS